MDNVERDQGGFGGIFFAVILLKDWFFSILKAVVKENAGKWISRGKSPSRK